MTIQILSQFFTKIVFIPLRNNLFFIVFCTFLIGCFSSNLFCQEVIKNKEQISAKKSSIPSKPDPKPAPEKKINSVDTIKIDSVKKLKTFLEGKVKYRAKEYARFDQKKKLLTLNDEAELFYLDYELKSGRIVFDYEKNEVYAGRLKDSAGNFIQYPYFKQGENVIEPDSIRFNYKTKKALVWNSRTEQGELRIKAEKTKKESDSVYFMKGARMTTSLNLDDPEYYFYTSKLKFVPSKKVVVGPTTFVVAGVPTPLVLPFAFFPMTQTAQSGILLPSYNQSFALGYSLQNGGYYFAINDKIDLSIIGTYFTNGSYSLQGDSSYKQRYKYNGNFTVRYEKNINEERGYPNYSTRSGYNIQWSHTKDPKSNPSSRFSSSVNFGSSTFFQNSINQNNFVAGFNNVLNSSISYSKTINTIPEVNFSLTTTLSQSTETKKIDLTLPTFTASLDRIFPFASKDGSKKGFFKNINFQYSTQGQNRIPTTDEFFFTKKMFDTSVTSMVHTIPLSTNFKLFKYFSATSTASFVETWTLQTIKKSTDFTKATDNTVTERVNGFDAFRTYSFSNSLQTTIYGTLNLKGKGRLKSLRHVMSPAISHNYVPSFRQYYESYETANGFDSYTRFDGLGSINKNYSSSIGLSLANTFEAKITDKDTTKTELKKIKLLNQLNFTTGYDIATKTWSDIRITGGTVLFNQKMNVNFGATIDPKASFKDNIQITTPLTLTSANLSFGYSFSNAKEDDKKKSKNTNEQNGGRPDNLFGSSDLINGQQNQNLNESEEKEFTGFYNSALPWTLNFMYNVTYENRNGTSGISQSTVSFNFDTDLTPKWKVGLTSGYDFKRDGLNNAQIRFNRDLLSWRMSVNWLPVGPYASWSFFIGIKASILSDVKLDQRTQPDRVLK